MKRPNPVAKHAPKVNKPKVQTPATAYRRRPKHPSADKEQTP